MLFRCCYTTFVNNFTLFCIFIWFVLHYFVDLLQLIIIKTNKMLDLSNKTVLNREIKKVKAELKNAKGLITVAVLEEQLVYLESKK